MSTADLHGLVKEVFPGFSVQIETTRIPAVVPPLARQRALRKRFLGAFPQNHSRLHGYLKWFAANWASSGFFFDWRYEAQILIPYDVEMALLTGKEAPEHPFGLYLLEPGENFHAFLLRQPEAARFLSEMDLVHPTIKYVDVYGRKFVKNGNWGSTGTIVECGVTDLSDLLLPIAAQVVHQVVWIPYSKNCDKDLDWTDFGSSCDALVIKPKPPSQAETRRIVRHALKAVEFLGKTSKKSRGTSSAKRISPSGTLAK